MNLRKRLLQLLLLVSILFTNLTMLPVKAEELREIKVHYTGSKENVSYYFWGDKVPEGESTNNWDTQVPLVVNDSSKYPYYSLWVQNYLEPWELGAIVRDDNLNKLIDQDIYIEITNDVTDIYLTDTEIFHLEEIDYVYIHVKNESIDSNGTTAWAWEDAHEKYKGGNWDTDRLKPYRVNDDFVTFRVGLIENAKTLKFLVHYGTNQTNDLILDVSTGVRDIYVKWDDNNIYYNEDFSDIPAQFAKWGSFGELSISFPDTSTINAGNIKSRLKVFKNNDEIDYTASILDKIVNVNIDEADFSVKNQYEVLFDGIKYSTYFDWQFMDENYATDAKLGQSWSGDTVSLNFWSPSAIGVEVVVYDKLNQNNVVNTLEMQESENVWSVDIDASTLGVDQLEGYYYQYRITRFDEIIHALDPYAPSMAPWNGIDLDSACDSSQPECIGKAAFVDVSNTPMETGFANIEGYEGREDAIIYEVHVRDFTSDIDLDGQLESDFGTFGAFVEKLDYIESIGVTHIQLLPVMSYYNINELNRSERIWDPTKQGVDSNYNWGYDPHSYFSLSGVYSENVSDASLRVKEFKNLIDEIHKRGMGVILDVVYNHTARTHIFEDLQPNYYHFMNNDGSSRTSFGGGRLGTTHKMSSRILTDSIMYWVKEFNVDGFRFDMMGDHDAVSIQKAYDLASTLNPNVLMLGEGWVTYAGDEGDPRQAADQSWMQHTEAVGVFSDEFRNELKSGFGSEGQPMFLTGGQRHIEKIFNNIKAQPGNFYADEPADVVNYIEAHDNLSLYDVIAQSIKKDPKYHHTEIMQRQRLGNFMVLTSQGTAFMQAGQEYGKTRQVIHEDYKNLWDSYCVTTEDYPLHKSTCMTNADGSPFEYPYFIHDSYNSSDWINHFDWSKATNSTVNPENTQTVSYTKGLIELRRSTDAFTLATRSEIDEKVQLLHVDEQNEEDLILAYKISEEKDTYIVIINADNVEREFTFDLVTEYAIRNADVLVDQKTAGSTPIETVVGISIENGVKVAPLTGIVLRIDTEKLNDFNKIEHPDIDEAAVFHAWNWSFENIENNMEAIKAAGFNAIQTSPVQPTKDDSTLASDWWLLYQPMDFTIGNKQLGDRDAFVSMVNKANELGMPIIVDVVINHMANAGGEELSCVPHPNIRPELRNKDYWREGCVENWASRDEVTQKGIGLPDLNTSHPEVQTIILNFLNELEDIGVAGFRFDAAKHIELPDDSATKSLFWNVLLNGLSEDTFIYGEIIQDSVDEIRKYASMMDVTGTSYGYKLMDALYSKNVTNLIDYSASGLDAPDLITWVESHDTYANENGHSQNLTDDDLRLGWAILAARKSNTPLFFNRPKSTLDSETLGDMGSDLWKYEDIVAINTFRQNMVGNDEYIRIMNNQVIGIERGSKGIAIVNLGDEAITISSETRLSDGVYYNEITSPTGFSLFNTLMTQTYQVTNGKLNGVIPARSVVILTFDEKAPVINTNITETSFDTETQDIDIVLEQAEKGRYRINGGEWVEFSKEITISVGKHDLPLSEYEIEIEATNEYTTTNRMLNLTKILPEEAITIYFVKPDSWGNSIYIYYYDDNGSNQAWPGELMDSMGNGVYKHSLPNGIKSTNVLFNDGSGLQFPKQNDPGLVITETAWIIGENTPVKTNPELNYSELEGVLEQVRNTIGEYTGPIQTELKDKYLNIVEQYPHYQDQGSIDDAKMQLDALLVNGLKQVLLDEINEIVEAIESKGYDDELLNIIREDVSNLRKTIDAEDYKVVLETLLDSLNTIDTAALEAKLAKAKAIEAESYTPETYEALQVIIKKAETVLASPESQEAVERAVLALDAAIAQLVFIEDDTEIPDEEAESPEIPDEESESPENPDEETETPGIPDENDEVGIPNEPDQDTEGRLPVTGVSSNPWGVLFVLAGLLTLIEVQRRREK